MTGHRRKFTVFVAAALVAATLAIGGAGSAGALTVDVVCTGDDSVQGGSLTSPDAGLNAVLQTLAWATAPNKSQAILELQGASEIAAGVSARTDPPDVPQGTSDITFIVGIQFGSGVELPTDEMDISNMLFELTPADGVTGAPLVGTPPDVTIPFPPTGSSELPFTASFDVTAPIGGKATWDLTASEIGIAFRIPEGTEIDNPLGEEPPTIALPAAVDVELGLSCAAQSNPIVEALVLPPEDPDGPIVPDLAVTTAEDTPVEIDLLAGVEDGPVAPTDPASLEIFIDPSQGTVSDPIDGLVTYTPNAGYVGDDNFAYLVCTEPYVPEPDPDVLVRGEIEEITSCNAGVVTITVEADEEPTTTTTEPTTSTTTPVGTPAPPQQVAGNFTG